MVHLVTLATCSLNQWALDYKGNTERILESIRQAKEQGATYRCGPELEICGYGLLDHFLEGEVFDLSARMLAKIIDDDVCADMVIDIGCPIMHRNVRYNCRVIAYQKRVLLIRPKTVLANSGNYREMRHFSPWQKQALEQHQIHDAVTAVTGQTSVPFGVAVINTLGISLAQETCQELWETASIGDKLGLDGVEIFTNSSGSHAELRKGTTRLDLILSATRLRKGIYLYANQLGLDGDRLYYDGMACCIVNGQVVAMGDQFALDEVQVVVATVDVDEVRSARYEPSRGLSVQGQAPYPRIEVSVRLSEPKQGPSPKERGISQAFEPKLCTPEEEIALCPAAYLYGYLKRSHAAGFFVPLSGGIDSCATSVIVFSMCRLIHSTIHGKNTSSLTRRQVTKDCRRMCGEPPESDWVPSSPQEICGRLFHTCFMGTTNSGSETRKRAKQLAKDIGAYHIDMNIDTVVSALSALFTTVTGFLPKFKVHGGSSAENLALQNIQARLRMVTAYLFAQLLPTVRQRHGGGGLLVLGSANVDEQLRGYLTKYDCSSSDINPIGGISKTDLKAFILYAAGAFDLPILRDFYSAIPTAELEPFSDTYVQSDEADMGVSYEDLSIFGRLRKVKRLGPFEMYTKLVDAWAHPPPPDTTDGKETPESQPKNIATPGAVHMIPGRGLKPRDVYDKVFKLNHFYQINRHKQTIQTPSLHLEEYSPDDNRFDLRPFVYPSLRGSLADDLMLEDVKRREEAEAEVRQNGRLNGEA